MFPWSQVANARADATAATARAEALDEEMLRRCPDLLGLLRMLELKPTSSRLTAGTGTRNRSSDSNDRAMALLAINTTACVVKVLWASNTLVYVWV